MTDFTELKKKQRATWALGEYDRIADGLTISTDQTMRVASIHPGERVLDLATGTGITAIAARERGAEVTGVDLTRSSLPSREARPTKRASGISISGKATQRLFLLRMPPSMSWSRRVATCSRRTNRRLRPNWPVLPGREAASYSLLGLLKAAWVAGSALPTSMSRRPPESRVRSIGAILKRCANSSEALSIISLSRTVTVRSSALRPKTSGSCSRHAMGRPFAPPRTCRATRWMRFAPNCSRF